MSDTKTPTPYDHWTAKLSEANDAIGAARDALSRAKTAAARRAAREDVEFWLSRKAYVDAARAIAER